MAKIVEEQITIINSDYDKHGLFNLLSKLGIIDSLIDTRMIYFYRENECWTVSHKPLK
jgi:hypothetical protein